MVQIPDRWEGCGIRLQGMAQNRPRAEKWCCYINMGSRCMPHLHYVDLLSTLIWICRCIDTTVLLYMCVAQGAPASDTSPIDLLGLMAMPKESSKLQLDFSTSLGPLFYTCE
jgi:hypothetical protein